MDTPITEENKQAVEILLGQFRDNYTRYVDNIWKTIQFTIIGIGWLITTVNGKATFAASSSITSMAVIVVIALMLTHIIVERRFFTESVTLYRQIIKNFPYVSHEEIRHWRIPFSLVLINTGVVTLLMLFILMLILKSPEIVPLLIDP